MRGGRVHILKDVGYRVGIHMKSYNDNKPVLVAGGNAGDFFGEYMAGGVLILLGMFSDNPATRSTASALAPACMAGLSTFGAVWTKRNCRGKSACSS